MKKVMVVFISSLMIHCASASTNVAFTCAQEAAQYDLAAINQTP